MKRYAQIAGTGRYVPARVITNKDFEATLGPVDEWLRANVGIAERHYMAEDEAPSDMATHAIAQALQRAKLTAADVDLLIVCTDTPDYLSPPTAAVVQHKLGARNAGVLDINAACAGWVTGFDMGCKQIMSDSAHETVVVCGVYGMSRFLDQTDKKTATLFADGAGAVVLRSGDTPGFIASKLVAFGEYYDALGIYTGGAVAPAPKEPPAVRFVRRFPPTFNTENWPAIVKELTQKAGITLDQVAQFVFTQLNIRTIQETMQLIAQPMSKAHTTMGKWGYTGSACIPMTLDDVAQAGKLSRGDYVIFCASGGGLAMAAALVQWS